MAKPSSMSSLNMPEYRARPGEWQEYRHESGETLDFRFIRSARRTIALYVHRDGSVLVRAPLRAPYAEIFLFLRERWDWMQRQRSRFSQEPIPRQQLFREGESILHLGEELVLRLGAASRARVVRKGGELHVAAPEESLDDRSGLAALVEAWQRREARHLFPERLGSCHEAMRALSLPFPQLKIRKMRSRWGSCSRSAVITLNLELVRMPLQCIDYVITHELCHLVEFNHSQRFYSLQESFLPDWRERRNMLEDLARRSPR
jgi:predicted metal-dependent hydrolase